MKLTANSKCLIFMLVFVFLTSGMSWGQSRESFVIASPQTTSQIILDKGEELVVNTAAEVFAKDVFNVSGALPQIVQAGSAKYQIKAGTLGVNNSFDRECRESGIEIDALRPKWEAYCIKGKIDAANGNKILYVVGSNPRGTAYGLMELSRMIGVSPWNWWADVPVKKMMTLEISDNVFIEDSPTVKYRGIFLNDEGWGLWPWAKKTFDPEFGDIGPKTYEKIFELMLRLRANHIWPAMHPNTKSFQLVAENREVAKKFGIVVGSSHAEPLLFNNAGPEWDSRRDGPWDYNRNKNKILEVLEKQVENASAFENIYTMGLRGIHDSKMQGIDSPEEGAVLLEKIFEEQRSMLSRHVGKPSTEIPQVFIPYKEVMEQYDAGLVLPEDITLMWANDNHGYIRRFSDEYEQNRAGRGGVYYHLSYLGAPHPYLWLSPTSPALVWREMTRARLHNMDQIWVANVGDLKRREWEMEFFLDMAWDEQSWTIDNLESYFEKVAARDISPQYAKEIGLLIWEYYRLATERKPEFMGFSESQWGGWTPIQDPLYSLWNYGDEVDKRVLSYQKLRDGAKEISLKLPDEVQDTYFQLVYYPIAGAAAMNEKWLYAFKSREYAKQGRFEANGYSDAAFGAFEEIKELTRQYNEDVSNGKWKHMTDYKPGFRNGSSVFFEPITTRLSDDGVRGIGAVVEGSSKPLKPVEGTVPNIESRTSIIKINSSEAKLSGELRTGVDSLGGFLVWPKEDGRRTIPGPQSWDAIPYGIENSTKAVFDFYFEEEAGGEHVLYLSVDHPDENSDSWWLTFNDKAPIQTKGFVGNTERLKATTVVLNPGWNRLTVYPGKSGAKLYGIALVQEAQHFKVEFEEKADLPKFNSLTQKTYFVDVYCLGGNVEEWTAKTSDPWIKLSKYNGAMHGDSDRIWVSIDYDLVSFDGNKEGFIEIFGLDQRYRIPIAISNQKLDVPTNAYIENNGVIAIPASGFSLKQAAGNLKWDFLVGLGRSGAAMILEPMTGWYVGDLGEVREKCPILEYSLVVLEGGDAKVIIEAVPSFPLDKTLPIRCAISINDGAPEWITFDMGKDGSETWQVNVLESRMVGQGNLELMPGSYKFKLWGTDPSINVDRILIDFGGLKPGYVGTN